MDGVDFPDPTLIKVAHGWHLFSTNAFFNGKLIHIQRAFTPDWKTFEFRPGIDALPVLPQWAAAVNPRVWAPDVFQVVDGSFVMYYTVAMKYSPQFHCLSYATTGNINDSFKDPNQKPWICPMNQGGAIDPASFIDSAHDGERWVVYKIDGNAIGHGGSCGNTVTPIAPTPILLQQVAADGHTLVGEPIEILRNTLSDGPYIEAPSLTFINGTYVLFFSAQCFLTVDYDVEYATADSITGPYTRRGRLLATGVMDLVAPGSMDLAFEGNRAIWHGNFGQGQGRAAYAGTITMHGMRMTPHSGIYQQQS